MSELIEKRAAIDALSYCQTYLFDSRDDDKKISLEDAEYAIEQLSSAQPEQQWIPCSERLPEDEYVLISKKPSKISGDKWCVTIAIRTADPRSRKIQWRDIGFGVIQDDKVLAWMPLPASYKGE